MFAFLPFTFLLLLQNCLPVRFCGFQKSFCNSCTPHLYSKNSFSSFFFYRAVGKVYKVLYQLSHTVFKSLQSTIRSFEYHYPIHPIPLSDTLYTTLRGIQKHYPIYPTPLFKFPKALYITSYTTIGRMNNDC